MAKKELRFLPIIGWMWYFLEIVFCKRKWEEDRRTVAESLQNLHDYPENFWVCFGSLRTLGELSALPFLPPLLIHPFFLG